MFAHFGKECIKWIKYFLLLCSIKWNGGDFVTFDDIVIVDFFFAFFQLL